MTIKTFILDSDVLLHHPDALFDFEDNRAVFPFTVIEEIDSRKAGMKREDPAGRIILHKGDRQPSPV